MPRAKQQGGPERAAAEARQLGKAKRAQRRPATEAGTVVTAVLYDVAIEQDCTLLCSRASGNSPPRSGTFPTGRNPVHSRSPCCSRCTPGRRGAAATSY
ncbi:hypothetical protein ACCAA_330021 [Candidatus Accumulibacter aalborgensis]|uniref:Uncharacterized protein n=1 Tax=Candidatus Accumulibacter aalborgensis TaxID=1860102 RepID=A0A1A8XMP1_9PROT|nr:hypothetical protein ACCAA_330021 [Candidatus Accumulibacter aalborgensis]